MSIKNKIKKINEMFMYFDNPMDKYEQIIDLGKNNPGISNKLKNKDNQIHGCMSLAWVIIDKNDNSLYSIQTDSDTFIVKGLLSILQFIIKNETKEEIMSLNLHDVLSNIGLENSITSQRTNGLINALEQIKKYVKNG